MRFARLFSGVPGATFLGLVFSSDGSRKCAAMQPRKSSTWSACAICVGSSWKDHTGASLNAKIAGPRAHELGDAAALAWAYMTHTNVANQCE